MGPPDSRVGRPTSGYMLGISTGQRYRTSSPVIVRPISIRWISDVPSKIVKIWEGTGRAIGIPARPPIGPCGRGYRRLSIAVHEAIRCILRRRNL